MSLAILGLGTSVPENVLTADDAVRMAQEIVCQDPKQRRLAGALYRKAGVSQRHLCVPGETARLWIEHNMPEEVAALGAQVNGDGGDATTQVAPPLPISDGPTTGERMTMYEDFAFGIASDAARMALCNAQVDPEQITHLVTVSCTGFYAPGVDIQLIEHLGLPATTQRTNVGFMGCHGAINGVRTSDAYTGADKDAVVLMCAVELCSLHYAFRWDPTRIVGNALFADGAAAMVGTSAASPVWSEREQRLPWEVAATGACLLPNSQQAMSWRVGDHGFEMVLTPEVAESIGANLKPWLTKWLGENDLTLEDVATWVIHPGGPKIVDAVLESLQLPEDACDVSTAILDKYGNMSSPTVMFILEETIRRGRKPPCVMLAFGPGLMAEAILWR